ncbi:hypothetical protein [Nocardioides currus]|uniref:Uncharacterized protein n=1 Tax=Nocardioides currus TaxID=2133958 RepID=A0A2R7Z0T9_9ACTN|nr:hypothetical protein [Nocardioides currus]PUA82232.1 hypothetical protein C7S10_00245 [Nocardioides currus]
MAEQSGLLDDPGSRAKIAAAREQLVDGFDDEQACATFSDLLELQGLPDDSHQTVNIVPSREDPQAVSGQSCIAGTYTSVALHSDSLEDLDAAGVRVLTALTAATGGR